MRVFYESVNHVLNVVLVKKSWWVKKTMLNQHVLHSDTSQPPRRPFCTESYRARYPLISMAHNSL